ncbi:hypothetical protein THAOC_22598, partial [Thalassiosira oceanica]
DLEVDAHFLGHRPPRSVEFSTGYAPGSTNPRTSRTGGWGKPGGHNAVHWSITSRFSGGLVVESSHSHRQAAVVVVRAGPPSPYARALPV